MGKLLRTLLFICLVQAITSFPQRLQPIRLQVRDNSTAHVTPNASSIDHEHRKDGSVTLSISENKPSLHNGDRNGSSVDLGSRNVILSEYDSDNGSVLFARSKRNYLQDLALANQFRRAVAQESGVYMPDLIWDYGLVRQVHNLPTDCNKLGVVPNTRFTMQEGDKNGEELSQFLYLVILTVAGVQAEAHRLPPQEKAKIDKAAADLEYIVNTNPHVSLLGLELLNPAQTKIGCARHTCNGVDNIEGHPVAYQFNSICLLGPSPTFEEATVKTIGKSEVFKKDGKSLETNGIGGHSNEMGQNGLKQNAMAQTAIEQTTVGNGASMGIGAHLFIAAFVSIYSLF